MPTLPWTFPSTGIYLSLLTLLWMVAMAQEWGERCNEGKPRVRPRESLSKVTTSSTSFHSLLIISGLNCNSIGFMNCQFA